MKENKKEAKKGKEKETKIPPAPKPRVAEIFLPTSAYSVDQVVARTFFPDNFQLHTWSLKLFHHLFSLCRWSFHLVSI
jgi:hypothetical protein